MTLLTIAEFKEHVTTTLGDDAIQRLLDDAEAQIVAFAGPTGDVTELVDGGWGRIVLSRRASAITSITELLWTTNYVLATNDWRQRGPYVLERLRTGTTPRLAWAPIVTIVYTPADDTDSRKIVQLELVKLEIAYSPGLASQTIGAWTEQYDGWRSGPIHLQRADILSRLREPGMAIVD